jgi:hypothetical protein
MGKYNVRVVVVKFFFCGEKKRQKATLVHFLGQNISFFQKQVAKFHPFFLGEIFAPSLHTGYTF